MKQVLTALFAVYISAMTTVTVFFLGDVKNGYCRLEKRLDDHIQNRMVHK